jgi:hypothetical protein
MRWSARHAVAGDDEEAARDRVGQATVVLVDPLLDPVDEGGGAERDGQEHVPGRGGDVEITLELRREALVQGAEEEPGRVVAVLPGDDGRPPALGGVDELDLEVRRVLGEVLPRDRVEVLDLEPPPHELLDGDAHRHLRQIEDEHDDGVVDEGDVRDLLAIEVVEHGEGLDAGHDPRPGHRQRERRGAEAVTLDEPLEVVLDDLQASVRLVLDHAVEVVEAEVLAVEDEIHRAGQLDLPLGKLPMQDPRDLFTERFGLSGHAGHGISGKPGHVSLQPQ